MLMCTIFNLTIAVQFGMDIQYIMIWKVCFFFNFIQACKCCNIKHFLCQFKKLVIILLVIFYNRLVLLYTVIFVIYSL